MPPFTRPLLLSHYSIWSEPPDDSGDEILRIASSQRSFKLKGHSFREFERHVVPLLDGSHTLDEIHSKTEHVFQAKDVDMALELLGGQGIVVEAEEHDVPAARVPQANLMRDLGHNATSVQQALSKATVAVVGLGALGASTAAALAAAGVGQIMGVDDAGVTEADAAMAPMWGRDVVGQSRVAALTERGHADGWTSRVLSAGGDLAEEEYLARAITDADMVVSCLDPALVNIQVKLARVCQQRGQTWVSASQDGPTVVVGPGVVPGQTACFMCYRMRAIAATGNPENAFAYERHLDLVRRDLGAARQNIVFAVGLASHHLGLEVVKHITGFARPSLTGRVLTIDLLSLESRLHTVLRKPWCPVCGGGMNVD